MAVRIYETLGEGGVGCRGDEQWVNVKASTCRAPTATGPGGCAGAEKITFEI